MSHTNNRIQKITQKFIVMIDVSYQPKKKDVYIYIIENYY